MKIFKFGLLVSVCLYAYTTFAQKGNPVLQPLGKEWKEINASTHFYFGPNGQVPLKVHPSKILVKFKPEATLSSINFADPQLEQFFDLQVPGSHAKGEEKLVSGAFVVHLSDRSLSTHLNAIQDLKTNDQIEYIFPFYQFDQAELAPTNLIAVKINSNSTKKDVETLGNLIGFQIVNSDKYDPRVYYLAPTSKAQGDVLQIANYLTKTGKFEFAEPDFVQFVQKMTVDPSYSQQWSIKNNGQNGWTAGADMDVELAWTITTGSPLVKIAVLDEGVDLNHPDLKDNLLPGYDATGLGSAGNASNDDAHGTACSGQISAIANNSLGGTGIAYGCRVMPIRIAYSSGGRWVITNQGVADAINWSWTNGASILSNSWGGGSPSSLIINAFNAAFTNGRNGLGSVVLASSGNGNTTSVKFPSNITNIIAVGASSPCDERKSPTSCDNESFWGCDYGTGLDVVAPGVKIFTTDISGSRGYNTGDYTSTFNGTSSACPNAAAVMALILSANPGLSASAARIALESTCEKIGGYSYSSNIAGQPNGTWAFETGYGRVNAFAAVSAAMNNPRSCIGTTVLNSATGSVSDGSGTNNYANNSNCQWQISPIGATQIVLTFTNFKTEANVDIVSVYNGISTTTGLVGTYSGLNLPPVLTITGGNVLITFTTNGSVTNEGWAANYSSNASGNYCSFLTTTTATSGTITDGSGTNNYTDNTDCRWLIQPNGAATITLTFTQFNTESGYDYVRVYDGSSTSAPLLGSYSGTALPPVLQSSGGSLYIAFSSDGSINSSGWSFNYTSSNTVPYCNGLTTLTATSGSFSDGSAGLNYLNNSSCTWVVSPANANSVTLTFNAFSTELNNDFVIIYSGTTSSAPVLGSFSGSSIPNSLTATPPLRVVFTSNSSVTGAGFSASYTSSFSYCTLNNLLTAPTGSLSDGSGTASYNNNTNCSWIINPPGATSITFQLRQFITEQNYDYVRIYNGTTTSAPLLGSYSGSVLPPAITNNGPILVSFTTDGSVNYDGWSATYTAGFTPIYCSGTQNLTASTGTITDGSGANNYGDYSNCNWLVTPSNSPTSIVFRFDSFNTEDKVDILTIYAGPSSSFPVAGTYSGTSLPATLTIAGSQAFLNFRSNQSVTGQGFSITYTTVSTLFCSGLTTITAPSGTVSDGSGSSNYLNGSNCSWLIQPAGASSISISFTEFSTESCCDVLTIYNGTTTSAPILGSYRGTAIPANISSNGPVLVVFTTDGSVVSSGWSFNYTSSNTPIYCSGNTFLTGPSGTFTDGSGANPYGNFSNCSWTISPTNNPTSIILSFTAFNTEAGNDVVRIFNGTSAFGIPIASFSGSNIPATVTMAGNSMFVQFSTNGSVTGQGWSASYTTTSANFCSGLVTLTSASGTISDGSGLANYQNGANCSWIIAPPNATSVIINFTNFFTESGYDYVYLYNGTTVNAPLIGSYTGSTLPASVVNNGPVFVRFVTDGSVTYDGWTLNYNSSNSPIYCNGVTNLTASSGTFTDGSGVNTYGNFSNCSWLISPSIFPNTILVNFSAFDTEVGNDVVTIYNGTSANGLFLASFSGSNLPPTVTINGSSAFVTFRSNASVTGQGFTASYNAFTSLFCNGLTTLTATSGTISDGSGAANYTNNTNCTWLINPPGATRVSLTFSQFALEGCCDYVTIYDGTTTGATILGRFNGFSLPPQVNSNGPMLVVFTTDGSVTYDGWTASYTSSNTPIYCSGQLNITSVSGTISDGSGSNDYNNNSNCSWLISPNITTNRILFGFTSFATESNVDVVRIYNGSSTFAPLLGTFSGSNLPSTITATGPSLFITFTTNASVTGQGWTATFAGSNITYCNGLTTYTSTVGSFEDGSGANNYDFGTNCSFLINPTNATSIVLNFTRFQTEFNYDFVRLYNGTTTGSPLIGTYSGSSLPPTIVNNGPILITFTSDNIINFDGWALTYTAGFSPIYCSGTQTSSASTGTITDGSGASSYANNSNCNWLISPVSLTNRIIVSFTQFDLETNNDVLTIYSGSNSFGQIVGTYTGSTLPSTLTINGSSAFINFRTNATIAGQGFTLNYSAINQAFCNGLSVLTAPSGTITDGSGTSLYSNNTNCSWLINPSGATSITFTLTSLATESCCDYVRIYNGSTTGSPILGTYGGSFTPASLTSNGPMLIVFYTDGSVVDQGWSGTYVSTNVFTPCAGTTTFTSATGTVTDGSGSNSYANNANCGWIISPTTATNRIAISFNAFDLETNNDVLLVYNGTSTSGTFVASFTGSNIPSAFTVTGSSVFLNFRSNSAITGQGFSLNYVGYQGPNCTTNTILTAPNGSLSDGSGNGLYLDNMNCSWLINPVGATAIRLSFSSFSLESCCDFVRIYNGTSTGSPLLGSFNGSAIPASVISNGPMLVTFTTDGSVTSNGWDATYTSTLSSSLLSVSQNRFNFPSSGGIATFTVSSSLAWTATSSSTWFTFSPRQGTGNALVTITVPSNLTTATLGGSIVLSNGSFSAVVNLVQSIVTEWTTEEESTLQIYPNPTEGQITIALGNTNQTKVSIKLKDILGGIRLDQEVLVDQTYGKWNLDLGWLESGTYILEIEFSSGKTQRKIVKL